jgi:hypothetical protein
VAHFVFYDPSQDGADTSARLSHLRWRMASHRVALTFYRLKALLRKANFNPNQPRVPRGNPGGGKWTDAGGSTRPNSGAVLSDAIPNDVWKPGALVAQAGSRGRGSYSIRVGVRDFEATPAQAMRYSVAEGEARIQIARVRDIDPNWRPTPSMTESIEGEISARRAEVGEARAKLAELARLPPKSLIQTYRDANNSRDLFGRETWPQDRGRWRLRKSIRHR